METNESVLVRVSVVCISSDASRSIEGQSSFAKFLRVQTNVCPRFFACQRHFGILEIKTDKGNQSHRQTKNRYQRGRSERLGFCDPNPPLPFLQATPAGRNSSFQIVAVDSAGRQLTDVTLPTAGFSVTFSRGDVTLPPVKALPTGTGGLFTVPYTLTGAGVYSVSVSSGGVTLPSPAGPNVTAPLQLTVWPGPPSEVTSLVTSASGTYRAGEAVVALVEARDVNNNSQVRIDRNERVETVCLRPKVETSSFCLWFLTCRKGPVALLEESWFLLRSFICPATWVVAVQRQRAASH